MRKKLSIGLLLGAALTVSLYSCRSEDLLSNSEEAPPSKFKVFTSVNGERVNYGEGFKILMEKHDSLNNEQHTAKAMKNAFENSRTVAEEYIEFNIRTKDQISDIGERWIVYPVISNSSVTGLVAGILNKEETTVEFRNLKPGNEYYDQLIPLFREQFQKSLISARQLNRNGKCGFPMQPPCEIDVIIITPPNSGGGIGIGIGGGGGEGTPKPCSKYENCIHNDPGGGGGGGSNGLGWKGPCEKLKEQNTPDFKANRNLLETNLNMKGETGFVEKHNGSFEYKDQSSTNEDSNSLSLGNPTSDMKGFMHTHVNDFTDSDGNTRIGFKIFSPADVIYFNQMVAIAHQNGIPLENIYAVMVSGSGTYQIRFTGSAYQIKTTYANTKVQYNEMYKDYFIKNKDRSNEMNFLKFIDEQMYVKGVTLIKMNSDGTNTKKTLNFAKDDVDDTNCL